MTIKTRLLAGMVAIGALFLIPLGAGVVTLDRMRNQVTQMRDREFAASVLLARVRSNVEVLRRTEGALVVDPTPSALGDVDVQAKKLFAMSSLLDSYGLARGADSLRAAILDIEALLPLMASAREPTVSATRVISSETALSRATNRVDRAIGAAERSLRESTDRRVSQVAFAMQRMEWVLLVTLIAAAVTTLIVALRLSGFVDRPLKALERGMGEVANGEFDQSLGIPPTRGDEFGRLAVAFTSMASRLKELEQMRASWLAMGTHELKNEVGPIIGYMDLLIDGVLGPLGEKQLEKCKRTKTLAERLKDHLLKYLAVSKLESGSHHLTPTSMELSTFLDEIESDFGAMAGSRNITFAVIRPTALSQRVTWDHESMREVMENLLSNAFKFTPSGGAVSLIAEQASPGVRLSVKDSGAGIPAEDVGLIFGKYFKARNQAKSDEKGTGLGLSIVRQIIEAHRGSIQCASTLGSGTTFTLSLPVDCTTEPAQDSDGAAEVASHQLIGSGSS